MCVNNNDLIPCLSGGGTTTATTNSHNHNNSTSGGGGGSNNTSSASSGSQFKRQNTVDPATIKENTARLQQQQSGGSVRGAMKSGAVTPGAIDSATSPIAAAANKSSE